MIQENAEKSKKTLARILPRIEDKYLKKTDEADWQVFSHRLHSQFPRIFSILYDLYGKQYDFFYHIENLLMSMAEFWLNRPDSLKALDAIRESDPLWFQSNRLVGAMIYVDLFSETINGLKQKIHYLKELGITYLHLMPIFPAPKGDNDGGYAISDYRDVNNALGTKEELVELAEELRSHGISLVLDFVFNHTSDEHKWAQKALSGNSEHQAYYRMYNSRELPDQFEKTINPIFPDEHQGCFTYRPKMKKWVWTTFHNFQWDLNYENPEVFISMAEEMMYLANIGVEVLRLDAVAFLWKKMGTSCENLPEAHLIIQAFNAITHVVAPALLFKSEAIVHPDEVNKYISANECQISYNPQLMALLWNSLATHETSLLKKALQKRFYIDSDCAWVNYIRCHDDVGWAFSDEDLIEKNINPKEHRRFLHTFYTGQFAGSFAKGLPFQENPETGDARISGTLASLAGLEAAIHLKNESLVDLAIQRILLLHGVILTIGGIPLLYLGDELGMLNDYKYRDNPEREGDSRWVHRSHFPWDLAEKRNDNSTIAGKIYLGLQRLVQIRKQNLAFSRSETEIMDTKNDHVLGYYRQNEENSALVLANFSDKEQAVSGKQLRLLGMKKIFTDIVSGQTKIASQQLVMTPYQFMVLLGVS